MKTCIVLLLTLALTSQAQAHDAHMMTMAEFRQRNEQAQVYMVLGAIALTG